jgi:hypothetical protein
MTEPLVAVTVDLRDFAFMPLDVVRLRDSDLAGVSSAEGFRAAVLLWCASWHQIPAASLPNDDRMLARLAGFGRDVGAWHEVKSEALRNFEECSDGRLYHPVIAEKANEAWIAKQERRKRVEAAIAARQAKLEAERRAKEGGGNDAGDDNRHEERDDARNVHQGTGTVDRDRDREESKRKLSLSLSEPDKPARTKNKYTDDFEGFWRAYPVDANMSKRAAFAAWKKLTADEQALALKAIPAYVRYLSSHPRVSTKHADNWLAEGKFEGHAERAQQLERRFFVRRGTPEWDAWHIHRRKSLPITNHNGSGEGWWCDTRWPPGHDPPSDLGPKDLASTEDEAA